MKAIICKNEHYTATAVSWIGKVDAEIRELLYQQEHRKVKDRYATGKFYANNFKKSKRKKK